MCDPATFTALGMSASAASTAASTASVLGTVASVGGTILSTAGAYNQAKAQQDQANYQAAVQRNNEIVAERKANDERQLGERQALQQKLRGKQLQSRQLVVMASQGADVTEGSNVDLLSDAAAASALEEEVIRNNSERRAYAHEVTATNHATQAGLFNAQAQAQNPLFDATTTGLTGFGNFASQWYKK